MTERTNLELRKSGNPKHFPMPTNPNTQQPATEGQNFVSAFTQLRRGGAAVDASEALLDVVQAVRKTGKKGTLTIKITVCPNAKGDDVVLSLLDDITTKIPKAERGSTIFFAEDDGTLVRNDPRQGELRFSIVEGKGAPPVPASAAK